jgi:BASS family bile acid:Na+ symporter
MHRWAHTIHAATTEGDGHDHFSKARATVTNILRIWTQGFVAWLILFAFIAYAYPLTFTWFAPFIKPGLGIIMFGMGMTLVADDFRRVATMPRAIACGVLGQFVIMPLVAYGLAKTFRLEPGVAMGFIILGACPGGTASNVIAYLARADVALSVTMTACSTVLAIIATPLLISWLGGEYLPVDSWALFKSVAVIVLIPVTAGFALRAKWARGATKIVAVFPAVSVLFIVLIVACIVGLQHDRLQQAAVAIGAIALLHNAAGLAMGYGLAALLRLPPSARRTVAIEVGMQNSGLGLALATTHFAGTLASLPSALFSIIHNITGPALATIWQSQDLRNSGEKV